MKVHKLALLISVLVLPAQELLADNNRELSQSATTKSTVIMPTQAADKLKTRAPAQVDKSSTVVPSIQINAAQPAKPINLSSNQQLYLTNGKSIVRANNTGLSIIGMNGKVQSTYTNSNLFEGSNKNVWIKAGGTKIDVGVLSRIQIKFTPQTVLAAESTFVPVQQSSPSSALQSSSYNLNEGEDKELDIPLAFLASEIQSMFQGTEMRLNNYGPRNGHNWYKSNDSYIKFPSSLQLSKQTFSITPMNKIPYRYYIKNTNLSSVQVAQSQNKIAMTFNFESAGKEIKGHCATSNVAKRLALCPLGSDLSAPDVQMNNAKATVYLTPAQYGNSISFSQVETDFTANIQAQGACDVIILSSACNGLTGYKAGIKEAVKVATKAAVNQDGIRTLVAVALRRKLDEHGVTNIKSVSVVNGYLVVKYRTGGDGMRALSD